MPPTEPVARLNQRERRRLQSRHQILEAAVEVFARLGFEAASIAEIASHAGVKKALVQYHFSTKAQLWKDAARLLWQERNACLEIYFAERPEVDLTTNMRQGFTALVKFTRERPQWLWFMFHEAASGDERMHWLVDELTRDDYLIGDRFIRHYQQLGLLRRGPPLLFLHLITGALTYNLLVAPQTLRATGIDLSSPEGIEQQVDLLMELITP